MMQGAQVCSGWRLGFSPFQIIYDFIMQANENRRMEKYDSTIYLINRGGFIVFMGVIGFGLLIAVIINENKRAKKK
jgi:hypothetical protein